MLDERPPRHPLHAHTIQARTHRKSMCCAEKGLGKGKGRAGVRGGGSDRGKGMGGGG